MIPAKFFILDKYSKQYICISFLIQKQFYQKHQKTIDWLVVSRKFLFCDPFLIELFTTALWSENELENLYDSFPALLHR